MDAPRVVGVVSAPALERRWWAATGVGAVARTATGGERSLRVSTVADLAEAQVCVTFSKAWDDLGLTPELVSLQQRAYRARGFGDFWQHVLVAEGVLDVAVDPVADPWDLAALAPVVAEAGGRLTDLSGADTWAGGDALTTNGLLHDAARAVIGR